ncbi:AMP-binding protein [uncultured Williamsia sp.]|uniref:AMP-binding protein n=1 Tax=uncultured Williamsia sp. TaxID=259311 RepID=UPI00260BEA2B|nr:AMP-binding protein [uncultured Williamsia sp.]
MPIGDLVARRALREPDEVLVVDAGTGEELTTTALDAAATALAGRLRAVGVVRDDTVVVALPTSTAMVAALVAVWTAGAVPLPVSPDLPPDERAHLDRLAGPAAVIGVAAPGSAVPTIESVDSDGAGAAAGVPSGQWASSWKVSTSSGSTGPRKLIRSTVPARFDPDRPVAPFLPGRAVQLVTADLWHPAAFTYAFRGLMTDHRLVLAPRADASDLPDIIRRQEVTWALMAPSLLRRLVRLPVDRRGEVPTLRSVVHLGAPCPPADKRALMDWLGPERVVEVYASSESFGLTMITGAEWLARPGSVGRGIGGTQIAVRDDDGRDLPAGEVGTVWMRRDGPPRYSRVGGATSRTDDGWDTAGDLGRLDADGWLYLVGRTTDRRSCGDTVVDLARVEEHLLRHGDVVECLVSLPAGQGLCADITLADHADEPAIAEFARAVVARHCRPGRIRLRRSPIRDSAGKARRPT